MCFLLFLVIFLYLQAFNNYIILEEKGGFYIRNTYIFNGSKYYDLGNLASAFQIFSNLFDLPIKHLNIQFHLFTLCHIKKVSSL